MLSGQHDDKLQQLQGTLKGQGEGACKVEVEAADATDPEQVSWLVALWSSATVSKWQCNDSDSIVELISGILASDHPSMKPPNCL